MFRAAENGHTTANVDPQQQRMMLFIARHIFTVMFGSRFRAGSCSTTFREQPPRYPGSSGW